MSHSDDMKKKFHDCPADRDDSITSSDGTIIRTKVDNRKGLKDKRLASESVAGSDAKTLIRNLKKSATDKTIQRNSDRKPGVKGMTASQTSELSHHAPNTDATRIHSRSPSSTPTSTSEGHGQTKNSQHRILKNRFLLEKVLGVGGMGVVYKAKDRLKVEARDREPYVAIKVLNDEFKTHPDAFISLQRESRKAQRLSQPNIVKVYDFDRDGDVVFMTMEYMEGKPLDQMIKQYSATGLPWDDSLEIIKGMCSALGHAHAENIIHSDFKPGNIFVTSSGMAKIFDFGIARAVTNVDRNDGKKLDKTVFDAGTLGALTPAYASMEMLQGLTPDVRDDIYALGCIVYEMLTGQHPFNKIPADEACQKKLKPKRIASISKRQWRAIEKSLAFSRSERLATADEFYHLFTTKYKPTYLLAASIALVVILSTSIYVTNSGQSDISEHDLRNEIEFKIRYDLYKEEINRLIHDASFTLDWEDDLWREVSGVSKILPQDDSWLVSVKRDILIRYIKKIRETRVELKLARARILIENAERYTGDESVLNEEKNKLSQAIAADKKQKELYVEKAKKIKHLTFKKKAEMKKAHDSFDAALSNVNKQLQCQMKLNMRDFEVAVKKLRALDYPRYKKMESRIINSLSDCIVLVGQRLPERAKEDKKHALNIFDYNSKLAAIKINQKDTCDMSIAGLGQYGKRGICRDKIRGIGEGPDLVVVPRGKTYKAFAIGKYEVTIGEINQFCKITTKCPVVTGVKEDMPAINISMRTVRQYVIWLSKKSGKKYRLPTKQEWVYASNATNSRHDPNRNCQLTSRGIQKGGKLVNVTTGKQNSWGLVNYLGNVREWVYVNGGKVATTGGSYQDSMEKCTVTAWNLHSGQADGMTGFRLLRELTVE